MNKLKLWFNEHRRTLWKIVAIIVFFLLLIRVLNYFASKEIQISKTKDEENNIDNTTILGQEETSKLPTLNDKLVLEGENKDNLHQGSIQTIDLFFAYCNEGKIKEAYNLLTDNCKEQIYPKLEYFRDNYYKTIFDGKKKSISVENWTKDTYKVEIVGDFLSTGNFDKNNIRHDYITIKEVEGEYKLNINKYVETIEINKSNIFYNNIDIKIEKKDVYMDYEIYTFKIKNNFDAPILIDDLKDIDSMYLKDNNNMKYSAYTHDIASSELLINPRETRKFSIKYYSKYNSEKDIRDIVFSKVIIDYYSYDFVKDENIFNNYKEIDIVL